MMKKVLLVGIPVLFVTLYSCDSKETELSLQNEDIKKIAITIGEMESEGIQSRMNVELENRMTYKWEVNDTVGIFPSKGGQVEFPIEGEGGETVAQFDGGGWGLKTNYSYSAYYPFNFYNRKVTAVPYSYVGQKQNGTGDDCREHLSDYVFMATPPVTVSDAVLNFTLNNVGAIMILHLTLPEVETYTSATIYTDADVIPVEKTINLQDTLLTQTATVLDDHLTIDLENITTTAADEVVSLWIAFPSVNETEHTLKVVIYDKAGLAYTADIYKKDKTTLSDVVFKANTYYNRYASPTLNSGFNIGIHDWGDGEEIEGTLQ